MIPGQWCCCVPVSSYSLACARRRRWVCLLRRMWWREGVSDTLDLVEVLSDAEVLLLHRSELHADLHDVCTWTRHVHLLQSAPHLTWCRYADDIPEHFLGKRGEDDTQYEMILSIPGCEFWVDGDLTKTTIFISSNADGLVRTRDWSINLAEEALTPEIGQELCRPEQIILLRELHIDHVAKRWRGQESGHSRGRSWIFGHGDMSKWLDRSSDTLKKSKGRWVYCTHQSNWIMISIYSQIVYMFSNIEEGERAYMCLMA